MQEVRLTPTSYIVLGLLEFAGESTPYGLKQLVSASVGNFWASGIYRGRQPEASNLCQPRFFPEKQRNFSILRSRVAGPAFAP